VVQADLKHMALQDRGLGLPPVFFLRWKFDVDKKKIALLLNNNTGQIST
jgi:hypothetical protein